MSVDGEYNFITHTTTILIGFHEIFHVKMNYKTMCSQFWRSMCLSGINWSDHTNLRMKIIPKKKRRRRRRGRR
jgi:hypothetical protein